MAKNGPTLEPSSRNKGYFEKWLDTPLTVKLSQDLWKIKVREKKGKPLSGKTGREISRRHPAVPKTTGELQDSPQAIKQFRTQYNLSQDELARFLGVARQTLSYYERGLRPLPGNAASEILILWRQKLKAKT